jgi:hypothetical protein
MTTTLRNINKKKALEKQNKEEVEKMSLEFGTRQEKTETLMTECEATPNIQYRFQYYFFLIELNLNLKKYNTASV